MCIDTVMSDLLQAVIQKYTNRDQLIQEGIWRGDLYGVVLGSSPKQFEECRFGSSAHDLCESGL